MFPKKRPSLTASSAIPRVSGGVSAGTGLAQAVENYSPRQRGCFACRVGVCSSLRLFPASAGVFPSSGPRAAWPHAIPRVSGGVSTTKFLPGSFVDYSPRQRGCFHNEIPSRQFCRLFPASAGVFPRPPLSDVNCPDYSPRQRGCFQVHESASHEAGPIPRVSGGVSNSKGAS